jgi:hypothetical protein
LKVSSFGQPSKFQVFEDLIRDKCHVPFLIIKKWWWIKGVHMSHVQRKKFQKVVEMNE